MQEQGQGQPVMILPPGSTREKGADAHSAGGLLQAGLREGAARALACRFRCLFHGRGRVW